MGAVAATLVALEVTGIADLDAPIDHIRLSPAIRLEVFQLVLWALRVVLVLYSQLRLWLWAIAPLIGSDESIHFDRGSPAAPSAVVPRR